MTEPTIIKLDAGESRPTRVPFPPGFQVKVRADDSGSRFSALEGRQDIATPPHVHLEADEWVFVIDGEMEVDIDGLTHRLTAGESALLPHGIPHAMRNVSQPPAHTIQVSSPGGWECYLEDLFESGDGIRDENGAPDVARINEIGARHGIRYETGAMRLPTVR